MRLSHPYLSSYPGYFWEPHWKSMGLPEIHYNDVIMGTMASQITSITIVYWTVYSGAENIKTSKNIKALRHWPLCGEITGDRKGQVTRKMFSFDDVIMIRGNLTGMLIFIPTLVRRCLYIEWVPWSFVCQCPFKPTYGGVEASLHILHNVLSHTGNPSVWDNIEVISS